MAKGQQRTNRETKKPKQEKKAAIPVSSSLLPSTKKPATPVPGQKK